MSGKRKTCLPLFLLLLGFVTAPLPAATVTQWREAIDRVVADIRSTHPDPFAKVGETRFLREGVAIKQALPTLTEEQRMVRAMRLVASLGDGHTQLQPNSADFARWYPFRLYQFEDGYYLTGVHASIADLVGAQVLRVNSRPIEEAATAARALRGADNEFDAKERIHAFHNAALMRGLGYAAADGSLSLQLRLRDGRTVTRTVTPIAGDSSSFEWTFRPEYWGAVGAPDQWISAYQGLTVAQLREPDEARPMHLRHRRAYYAGHDPARSLYYIQSNVVGGTAEESLPAFFRRQLSEIDRVKPRHLVIDLRYNFGGDGSNVPLVIRQFLARGDTPPWQNLYLLTGRRTFSAGVLWTAEILAHLRPSVIGEPAGAPLNSFGDANSFDYVEPAMRMFVSYERHQKGNSRDLSSIIPVDIPARFTFADYVSGRDPALDAISQGNARSIGAIAAAEGAGAAFDVYEARRARFQTDPTWRPTSELDLRTLSRDLEDGGRRREAIEVASLNTQINPREWRTWMNLGDLQMRAGQPEAAIENYRRSLALNDPTNFNRERLERAIQEAEARRERQPQK